ncbi:MAG TPA: response regulator transcription factor [Clostridia bacterium]|nr:response regulator transcription factor [Clostridia bacterium]
MAIKILVADDEMRIRKIIGDYLENEGYETIQAENGKRAIEAFYMNDDIDLVILDVMMPEKNGWEVCKEIREESDVPVIFLTALGETHDEIKGLDLGADDYIPKPFGYERFMARVRSALRRAGKSNEAKYKVYDLSVDPESHKVRIEDEELELSPKEFELLVYMLENKNIALERDAILDAVWGYDFYGDPRTVDTHIKNLRAKIGKTGACIKTVRGIGYKFEVGQ